eukprot:scaffold1.g5768.t1
MSVVVPVATQVGLQLLLQPYAQGIGRVACTAAGVVYPAYASFKAVEALATSEGAGQQDLERQRNARWQAAKWLCYWGVYGVLTVAERVLDRALPWVPYYQTIKLAFLLWLQARGPHAWREVPRYEGAQRLAALARPWLLKAQPFVDETLVLAYHSMRQPMVVAALEAAHHGLSRVPWLEWFVRGPDGRPQRGGGSAFITDSRSD